MPLHAKPQLMARNSSRVTEPSSSSMSSFLFLRYWRSLLASCGRSSCREAGIVHEAQSRSDSHSCIPLHGTTLLLIVEPE